ncbi:MAG TPA: helix-turn-helix transcriptional regulator [Spirochaetota bacterium]|nr:helix-turn-helix transcriptional regulator [Spirochaetota bacterium]
MEELEYNMREALNLYLDEPSESNCVFPLPDEKIKKKKNIVEIPVDPEIAFAVLLRHLRNKHNLSQNQAAKLLGMKNVYSYQRLEKRANPNLKMIHRIKEVFPELRIDSILNV